MSFGQARVGTGNSGKPEDSLTQGEGWARKGGKKKQPRSAKSKPVAS